MVFKEIKWEGMKIVMSEGGCSIIGDWGDLTMPSKQFEKLFAKHGLKKTIMKTEMIKFYKKFFKK